MASSPPPPLALIAGPTASGKSALAVALAERANGVVINADSAQVYRELRILTARPGPAEEARAPHRLYGYRDGAEAFSAARWAGDAAAAIDQAHVEGRLPILTGGTGLYIRTLIDGIAPVPEIDAAIRAEVRALPAGEAHRALSREDPQAAARLAAGDTARTGRALEVVRSTGRTLTAWQLERRGGIGHRIALHPLLLLPPKAWLHARCDARFIEMVSDEGLTEVSSLLKRGLDEKLPVMRALGVATLAAMLRGDLTRDQAVQAGQLLTRQYAKRQYTWFSRQPPDHWPRLGDPLDCGGMEKALAGFDARLPR